MAASQSRSEWFERTFGPSLVRCDQATVIGVLVASDSSAALKMVLGFYNTVNRDGWKRLEVVQILPKDSAHFQDLPWFAAPTDRRERLLRRYRIRDPSQDSLILLDASSGDVITTCGLERLQGDPEGKLHPWTERNVSQILRDARILNSRDVETPYETLKDAVKGLYFSAYWCPPCKAFTPQLAELYKRVNAVQPKQFEVIFVSSDRSQESFTTYHSTMPWLAIAYDQEDIRRELATLLGVQGIPSLIVLDTNDHVITREGRAEVNEDVLAKNFPWKPKAVNLLTERFAAKLHETPAVIIFIEGDAEEIDFAESVLRPAAEKYGSADCGSLLFLIGCDCDTSDILREFVSLDDIVPMVALVDIPSNRFANLEEGTEITPNSVKTFAQQYIEETLPMQTIHQRAEYIS